MKRLPGMMLTLALAALVAAPPEPLNGQGTLAIRGGRVVPVVGDPIEGGTVLIEQGRIKAVGKEVEIPVEAKVIDATGKVVLPGFVDVHSPRGMSQANEQNPLVPYVSVVDTIDPSLSYFEDCRRNGITSAGVAPGNSTMIGGQSAVVKTAGQYVDDMLVKRNAGLKISLSPTGNNSRMSHYARLRKSLDEVREEMADPEKKEGDQASSEDNVVTQKTALQELLRGELPAFIHCENAMDVAQARLLMKEYGIRGHLVLGRDVDKAAAQLAELGTPVILDPQLVFWRTDERTGEDEKVVLPEVMAEHKVPYVFQVSDSSFSTRGSNFLWYQAAVAVKYGLSRDDALRAMTIMPAQILGVDRYLGSLEPGKDGDVVVLSGDPLKVGTWVDYTIVNGEVVYDRASDRKLEKLLQGE